jgi:hypothetical protein
MIGGWREGVEIYCIFIAFFGKKKPDTMMHRVSFL